MEPQTILVVDDYAPNLLALEAALEPLDHRVVKASSGEEALKFLLSERCALILLDVNMPGQDGFETADMIRARPRTRDIPILFVTAAHRRDGPQLAAQHGAADYIVRPIEPDVLRTKVRAILELREQHLRADQEVRASRDQLEVILASVSEAITAYDAEGHLVFANDEAARMSGFASRAQMLAAGASAATESFEARDEAGAPLRVDQFPGRVALRTGARTEAVLRVRRKRSEDDRWVRVRSMPVPGASGKASLVINVFQDVTEQRRSAVAAELLAEAGRALGSSLDADAVTNAIAHVLVPCLADWCAVHVREPDGSIRLCAIAGGDEEAERRAKESAQRHPVDPAGAHGIAAALRSGKTQWGRTLPDELLVDRADSAEHLSELRAAGMLSYVVIPLSARAQVLGTLTLVTTARSGRRYDAVDVRTAEELADRVAAALDNAALYKREQEAVRVRDDFLSIASHELRTPLTPLRLQTQVLRRLLSESGPPPREKVMSSLDTLDRQTERLARLVSDLLDVSRITVGKLTLHREAIDLAELARDVVERYAPASRSPIGLQARSASGSWDRARLEQVATNLLANAIKYGEGKPIDVVVEPTDREALLVVRDRGIGIAPQDTERIFNRFERATSATAYGGLGLGLYIAQQIATAHGGKISVESTPGEGATFTVALPLG
jgi:signal transduction histidine kinase/DNA-binding response OmpR family regulator